ncbi:MAG: RluA family pseudouridine synthase [Rhodospirillaceae bacterium]|nr:RluA family pseudouridine synthase [Rhodospirillaceae bacterium]
MMADDTGNKTAAPKVKSVLVPDTGAGARLDKWLAENVRDISRSRLKALIEDGAVTVAGKAERDPAYRLRAGQTLRVILPDAVEATPEAQDMDLDIAYEDEHLIVVNKPVGLVVHPAPGNPDLTLVNALLAHCGDSLAGIGGVKRPGIVHRIDKDTSGLLVAAKTEAAHAGLSAQFAAHSIERRYDAIAWGVPHPRQGTIAGNIGRSRHNRQKMALLKQGGKPAETGYTVITSFGDMAAHVRCRLKTGRTHQIRVHMASIGHPLIGDSTYGSNRRRSLKGASPELAALLREFPRQALHAATLGFIHPVTGKKQRFAAPPPEDFMALLAGLSELDEVAFADDFDDDYDD